MPRNEGYNHKIKQIKRMSCGFRNQQSYQRRIMLNNAATAASPSPMQSQTSRSTTKSRVVRVLVRVDRSVRA